MTVAPKKKSTEKNKRRFQAVLPAKCKDICEDTKTRYPTKKIQKLIKRKKYLTLFNNKGPLLEPASQPAPFNVLKEQELESENLCRTRTVNMFPKAALNLVTGEPALIVNVPSYQQNLIYETCVDGDGKCVDKESRPYGFQTACKQKYNKVRLVSINSEGKLEHGKFFVPSTCVCSSYTFKR
ncbi:uncharacterized protein LOC115885655 isoform X2 [Sitophilus oryzae]|nr:uncharacterized protein LOC115885655 isoform X2 [Sitophilus oryzae]XP_030760493.1 uncharacterized protein LOC115885655 isoform X2 [Sitophilus oryzae]